MDVREKLVELIDEALQRKEGIAKVVGEKYVNTIATHLIAHGVTVQEWVKVEDRMPDERGEYIVMVDGAIRPTTLIYDDDCWTDDDYGMEYPYKVTHWMPLPQPPK